MVRPVDTELLQDICEDIALDNYGFLYVSDHKAEIQDQYEQGETSLTNKGSVSLGDIKESLSEIAERQTNSFERLRGDAYFLNPFEKRQGRAIGDELQSLFTADLVVNANKLESRFHIAPTDVDFFARQLIHEDYVERIPAGERDYFVSGPKLKDETSGEVSLDAQLKGKADTEGKISHRELEEIIDVAATSNVINYLSQHDFIIDLEDEYLVEEALEEYVDSVATEIQEAVAEEFEAADYVLHDPEFEQIIENIINDRRDILQQARSIRRDILNMTEEALEKKLGLERERDMAILHDDKLDVDGFEEFVDSQAEKIKIQVARSDVTITKPSDQKETGKERIQGLQVGRTEKSREYIREQVQERYNELVDAEWS